MGVHNAQGREHKKKEEGSRAAVDPRPVKMVYSTQSNINVHARLLIMTFSSLGRFVMFQYSGCFG